MVLGARARGDDGPSATPTTSAPPSCSSASCSRPGPRRAFEGEVSASIGAGAFVALRRRARRRLRGFPARRGGWRGERFDLDETETAIVGRRSGRRSGSATRSRCASTGSRRRAAASIWSRSGEVGGDGKKGKRKAAAGDVATNRRASHTATSSSSASRPGSSCRDRGQVAAGGQGPDRRRLRDDRGRRGLAAQRPHPALRRRRASRTTIPSGRGSCSCTATRSTASSGAWTARG